MLGSAARAAIRAPHYVRATTQQSLWDGLAFFAALRQAQCERCLFSRPSPRQQPALRFELHLALAHWTLLSLRGAKAH
jgi:hypothetical protein